MPIFDYRNSLENAERNPFERLPAGFLEVHSGVYKSEMQENLTMSESWNMDKKLAERRAKILEITGEDIGQPMDQAFIERLISERGWIPSPEEIPGSSPYTRKIADLAAAYPDDIRTDAELEVEIKEDSRRIRAETAKIRENTTFVGTLGSLTGALAAVVQDPPVLASMLFGASWASGVVRTALVEAGVGVASEIMVQPKVWQYKKKLDSPHSLGDAGMRIVAAGVGAGVLGGAIKGAVRGVGRLRKPRLKGIDDLVEEARKLKDPSDELQDAIDYLDDYADTLRESPFDVNDPVAAEAHMRATSQAIADVGEGRPPDVKDIVGNLEPREEIAGPVVPSRGTLDLRNPPISTGENPIPALRLGDGSIVFDVEAKTPFDVRQSLQIPFDQIEEGGFILPGGKYIEGEGLSPELSQRPRIEEAAPESNLIPQIKALIEPETGALSQGVDVLNELLSRATDQDIADFLDFARGGEVPEIIKGVAARLSDEAAQLRARQPAAAGAKIVKEPKKPTAPTLNQGIDQFVKNSGGVSINKSGALRGEFEALLEQGGGKSGSIKRNAGRSADEMSQLAHEAGFIAEPDPALLAEAMDAHFRGEKVFSEQGEVFQVKLDRKIEREWDRWAEAEEEQYLKELETQAKGLLEEEDVELSRVVVEREGEAVVLSGKEAGEALESREGAVVRRSAREMLQEAEEELNAGQIISKCLMGV